MAIPASVGVKVQPGQTLAFKPSKGLTAVGATAVPAKTPKPPVYKPSIVPVGTRPPAPPVDPYAALSAAQVDQRATDLANANLTPQQQAIERQQAIAHQNALADEAAISGLSTASADYLRDIPAQVGAGYRDAAATVGQIGTNVGGTVGADLAAEQSAGQQFAESQGQGGGQSFDGKQVGDTVSYLGGVIPGENLAHQGAAAQAEAAKAVQIPLDAGAEQLTTRMAQAKSENDNYAQQLIQLAATFPGLKAQALQQLNQYEIDKANYREQVSQNRVTNKRNAAGDVEQRRVDDANITHTNRSDALQARAEAAQEKAAGIKATNDKSALAYKWASLQFQSQKEIDKVKASGKIIDVGSSRLLGHVVYKDGSEDPSIHVRQTTGTDPHTKALQTRAKATSKARVDGYRYAVKLRGKAVATDKNVLTAARATGKKVGTYVADPKFAAIQQGHQGAVFPPAYPGAPATTNRPERAAHSGGGASDYTDASSQVWAEIDGDGLMSRFGYSRQQVLAIVNAALRRSGWRK